MFKIVSSAASSLAILLVMSTRVLAQDGSPYETINERAGYKASSSGDPLSGLGAEVVVSSGRAEQKDFGGIIYRASSLAPANGVVRLSAVIEATQDARPWIWVRADSSSGKSQKFITSAVRAIPADGHVSVDLRIPPDSASLAFGIGMRGPGRTTAKDFRLEKTEQVLPGNEASAEEVYDEAEKVVLENAYWASNLHEDVRNRAPSLSSSPGTGYQAEQPIRALLRGLRDSHSFYYSAEDASRYSDSGADPGAATTRLIDGNVGYVLVPGVHGTNQELTEKFAAEVGGKLKDMNRNASCGWIVDLRSNSGGSMWPMVSALSIFFGNERLGGFKSGNGSINWWSLQSPGVVAVSGASDAKEAKVAVLVGPKTTSSGEAIAVAFIGRNRTRSFGAPTNGRATSNRKFALPDGSAVYVTSAIDLDRHGREVGPRIVPDTLLPEDVVSSEQVPEEALRWLKDSCSAE